MYTVVILLCVTAFVSSLELPPDIPTCSLSDEHFDECLRASVEIAFSVFSKGNKELEVLPLDPLHIDSVTIEARPGPISIQQTFTNANITGLSKIHVKKFVINLKNCHMQFEALVPLLEVNTNYKLKGQMLVIPIDASGILKGTHKNLGIQADINCKIIEENKIQHIHLVSTKFKIIDDYVQFKFGTIIKGNEQLDREFHKVFDDNPMALWQEIKPSVEPMFGDFLTNLANNLFKNVPLHNVFRN